MKKLKSVLAVIMVLMMLSGISAYADDTAPTSGTCGENLTWSLSKNNVLTIEGDGEMTDYLYFTYVPWYQPAYEIKSVVFTGNVTNIGDYAFSHCSLRTVTLPDTVTIIGNHAFENCKNIAGITLPSELTSIGDYAFFDDWWLDNVVIPDEVISIGESAFNNCGALKNITVPDSVGSIGKGAFYNCTALNEISIPEGVTEIGDQTFYKCGSLENVTLPDSLASIGEYAFSECTSFTSLNIPANVSSIGTGAFGDCGNIESITVDSGNKTFDSRNNCNAVIETESNVLVIGCKNTVMPKDITAVGDYAFRGCTGLESVVIPEKVTSIGDYAFTSCSFGSITLPEGLERIGFDAFGLWGSDSIQVSYYGKEADKAGISIDKGNDILTASEWNYLANPKINVADEITVNYKSDVVIRATGTDIPEGMHLVMFIDGRQVAEGTDKEVTYEAEKITSDIEYTVMVVDGKDNIQQDVYGNDLVRDGGKITCKTGFFAKLIAFFRTLFRLPLTVTVNP